MFFHSKQNETIIAAWAEPAEHNQLTLTECFSLLKWVDLAFPTFFSLGSAHEFVFLWVNYQAILL